MNSILLKKEHSCTTGSTLSLNSMVRLLSASLAEHALIQVTKPYKPRKLKTDMIHVMQRRLDALKRKNPANKRKTAVQRKKYLLKNGRSLKKRAEFVRKARERMHLNKPGTENHRNSGSQ